MDVMGESWAAEPVVFAGTCGPPGAEARFQAPGAAWAGLPVCAASAWGASPVPAAPPAPGAAAAGPRAALPDVAASGLTAFKVMVASGAPGASFPARVSVVRRSSGTEVLPGPAGVAGPGWSPSAGAPADAPSRAGA
ncbi:hypothetical protein [Streptomyces albogriseolus]|uniref:hypothetical protein n=1 Tax=Streptomyces albogriseolus TaxID=1887 RepID=UPI0035E26358